MIKLIGIFVLFFAITNCTYGQYGSIRYHNNAGSTVEGDILRGAADLNRSRGDYLEGVGHYAKDQADADAQNIKNYEDSVRSWHAMRDEAEARFKKEHPSYVEREMKRMDMLEKNFEMEQRRKYLGENGINPIPPSSFSYNGKKYGSYAEFKSTLDYKLMLLQAQEKSLLYDLAKLSEEVRYDQAVRFGANWDRMGYLEQQRYIRNKEYDRYTGINNTYEPHKDLTEKQEKSFQVYYDFLDNNRKLQQKLNKSKI